MKNNIISLSKERLKLNPVKYTIEFTHDKDGLVFNVFGIQDTTKDRLAVARDLEDAVKSLRQDCNSTDEYQLINAIEFTAAKAA